MAEAADPFGVSWPTAHATVIEAADVQLVDPGPVTVLGIDETRRGRPRWTWGIQISMSGLSALASFTPDAAHLMVRVGLRIHGPDSAG